MRPAGRGLPGMGFGSVRMIDKQHGGINMKGQTRRVCVLLIFLLLLTAGWAPDSVALAAGEPSGQVVRVGYYEGYPLFQNGFSDDARKSGYAYEYYQALAVLTGWTYEYVYGSRSDIIDMLSSGEVDIVAGIRKTDKRAAQMLFPENDMDLDLVGAGSPYYLAVSPKRADLLAPLDAAIDDLQTADPKFTVALYQKYYEQYIQLQPLTYEEQNYLAGRGALSIGYVGDNLPVSDVGEDGTPAGVAAVVLSRIEHYLNIPLKTVCYETVDDLEAALYSGEIDAAFPVYYDLWRAESKGLFQTEAIISDRVMIAYEGQYRDDLMDRVAISRTSLGQLAYLSSYYAQSEPVHYESRDEAFRAVRDGDAGCIIGSASILQRYLAEHPEFRDFHIAYLDYSEDFSLAVRRSDPTLARIMNKAVTQLDRATITSSMVQYSDVEPSLTFHEFLRQNAIVVMAVLAAFLAVILLLFAGYYRRGRKFHAEQVRSHQALADALSAANAANNAKTSFLSSMSHDIRTPMNGIIGMTAIAAAHIDDKAKVERCLEKITSSSKHLLALINEVLDMSKIESGKVDLNEELFDLAELVDNLVTLNKPQADAKNQSFNIHVRNIAHERVIGDSLRLQQVFTNLVSNAVKYTPEGGDIEITFSEKPSGSPKLGCYEFVVEDNGIGMSAEYLPHVFEPFSRDESAVNLAHGTGLGMPIARTIVRMMNGDISVESTLGKGSKFTASLFLQLPDTDNISYEDFIDLNILVVDDDPIACESACLLLDELGMRGEWVLSGREAVARVEERHQKSQDYFAILLDWKMPDMDGIETTREIRRRVGGDVPIIVISAYDWSTIEAEALAAGAHSFIGKPLFKSRLALLFHDLLKHEAPKASPGLKELTEESNFDGRRVLLVEDNELNEEIAVEILGMMNLDSEWAHNGKEAVDMLERSPAGYYDCIFMDVQMPVMNGLDATKAIRALSHPDARRIPIFAMTANVFVDDVMAAKAAGMNEHIMKPLDIGELVKVLRKYLS